MSLYKAVRKQDGNVGVVFAAAWDQGIGDIVYFAACESDGLQVTFSQVDRDTLEVTP